MLLAGNVERKAIYPKKVRGKGTDPQPSQEDQSMYKDEQLVEGFLGTLSSDNTTDSPWSVTLQLNGTEVAFHIAEVTVISNTEHQKLCLNTNSHGTE